ncbi:hypothetical protein P9112_008324 [Eukaryota sp. TZLM1-RC]
MLAVMEAQANGGDSPVFKDSRGEKIIHFSKTQTLFINIKRTFISLLKTSSVIMEKLPFGTYSISKSAVYIETELSYVTFSYKPFAPYHTLVIPKSNKTRFVDLSSDEVTDLWQCARAAGSAISKQIETKSIQFCLQDGKHAGQTVPAVHIHVIASIDSTIVPDVERKQMTVEEMAEWANELKSHL